MRTERWWQEASVTEEVFKNPSRFEFIQTTRLLRHLPVQLQKKYWADDFRFESSWSLNFPESEIESLQLDEGRVQLCNRIVGLTGIQGALPYTYTSKVKQASRQQRQEVQQFLSLFNHPLTAQYVDASLSYNLPIRYEVEQENHYLNILHALNGYVSHQHHQQKLDDYFAEFSGLMQGQNNSAYALKTILSSVFKQKIKVNEFIVEKFQLAADQRSRLGGEKPSLLGLNSFCGEQIRQADGKVEIEIGPLSYAQYLEFLPNRKQSNILKNLIQSWCSPTLLIDLRLILAKDAVQPLRLSSTAATGLAQGAFLMPQKIADNNETCYALVREI